MRFYGASMWSRNLVCIAFAASSVAGCGATVRGVPPALLADAGEGRALRVKARVAHVVDGDTLVARVGAFDMTVRLLGIDTPETVKPGAPVGCFGPEASARTKALLPAGSVVWVETDVGGDRRDMYGRLLGYVTPGGARSTVNATLLREGFADLYVFHPSAPFHRARGFRALRDDARAAGRGMWRACPHPALR